jgi:hypothetical protein
LAWVDACTTPKACSLKAVYRESHEVK